MVSAWEWPSEMKQDLFMQPNQKRELSHPSPEIAEALACRLGVQLAISMQLDKVHIESDCLTLIQNLNMKKN